MDERAGERDALLLPAGKLARKRVEAILQAELDEQLLRLRDGLAPLHAGGEERHGRVLGGGQRGQQIVLLEDEPEIFPAKEDALLRPEALDMFRPKSSTSPPELSSRPAITESSVVFPQPLGPTRKVVSPKRTSKSTPRSASTRALPEPNSFFKSRQWTAVSHGPHQRKTAAGSSTSTRRMLSRLATMMTKKMQPPVSATFCHMQDQPARGELLQRDFEERRGHAGADREADGADGERLQQDHADEPAVGDADGFERAELFQVLDGEKVERLPRDDRADDERDRDGDAEVHRDAGVREVVADAVPAELVGRPRAQAGVRLDAPRQLRVAHTRLRPREDERELVAFAALEVRPPRCSACESPGSSGTAPTDRRCRRCVTL